MYGVNLLPSNQTAAAWHSVVGHGPHFEFVLFLQWTVNQYTAYMQINSVSNSGWT